MNLRKFSENFFHEGTTTTTMIRMITTATATPVLEPEPLSSDPELAAGVLMMIVGVVLGARLVVVP